MRPGVLHKAGREGHTESKAGGSGGRRAVQEQREMCKTAVLLDQLAERWISVPGYSVSACETILPVTCLYLRLEENGAREVQFRHPDFEAFFRWYCCTITTAGLIRLLLVLRKRAVRSPKTRELEQSNVNEGNWDNWLKAGSSVKAYEFFAVLLYSLLVVLQCLAVQAGLYTSFFSWLLCSKFLLQWSVSSQLGILAIMSQPRLKSSELSKAEASCTPLISHTLG